MTSDVLCQHREMVWAVNALPEMDKALSRVSIDVLHHQNLVVALHNISGLYKSGLLVSLSPLVHENSVKLLRGLEKCPSL